MIRPTKFLLAAAAVVSLLASAAASAQRYYDPPSRVARISDMRGDIAYSPAGDGDWYSASRNRPIVRGDALWSDSGARAELQAGSTWIRMDQETSVEFLELSDRMLQLQVTEGTLNVRIRRIYPGQKVEVDTPNLAFVLDRPGNFRIDVDRQGDNTTIEAREGSGMVYGVGGRFPVRGGDTIVFYGEDVRDYQMYASAAPDGFDRYTRMRDMRIDRSPSLRYLGDELVGFSDLDDFGRWSRYPDYGSVWFPSNVYAGWAPYQDGQWVWQEPWGWTWVDDEPWGFAPSHYGRWAWIEGRWGWIPGPRSSRPTYAPALVAFIEDVAGSIGWFPLGPGDVYYPSYSVSSNYFNQVNLSNSAMSSPNLGRDYSSYGRANAVPLAQGAYRNRTVPTAVTVVPRDVFTNSRPVREAAAHDGGRTPRVPGEMRRDLGLRPGAASMRGAASAARSRPPRAVEDEQVFVRTAPPPQAATPSAGPTPAPAMRERPRRVRMISEASSTADARATGPRGPRPAAPGAPASATPAAPGARLQPLDREALPRNRPTPRDPEPVATPASPAAPATPAAAASDQARQAEEARAAAQKAREERRQAVDAERKSQQEATQAQQAAREAQQQRSQAEADSSAQQQREAAQAQAKAQQESEQAREAQRQAQIQQREAERAQRQAEQQQREAAQAAQASPAAPVAQPAAPAPAAQPAEAAPGRARECVPLERIEAMRARGASEERIAQLKVCPAPEAAPAKP